MKDRPPIVLDLDRLSVHGFPHHDLSSPRLDQRLVAQTHAQRGDVPRREPPDGLERDPRFVRRAGARRDDDPVIAADQQLLDGGVIVAHDLDLRGGWAQFPQELHQVVREAVVVVDDEHAHPSNRNGSFLSAKASSTMARAWAASDVLANPPWQRASDASEVRTRGRRGGSDPTGAPRGARPGWRGIGRGWQGTMRRS